MDFAFVCIMNSSMRTNWLVFNFVAFHSSEMCVSIFVSSLLVLGWPKSNCTRRIEASKTWFTAPNDILSAKINLKSTSMPLQHPKQDNDIICIIYCACPCVCVLEINCECNVGTVQIELCAHTQTDIVWSFTNSLVTYERAHFGPIRTSRFVWCSAI